MLLNELTGIKAIKDKNPLEILQWIKDQIGAGRTGLRFLGKGSHGVALTDGKTVFKFWHKDSAYEKFVDFVRYTNYDCLPKFKSGIKRLPFSFTTKSLDAFVNDYTKYREDIEDELGVDIDELDIYSDEYREWEDAPSKYVTTEGFSYIKMEKLDPVGGRIELFSKDSPFYGQCINVLKLISVLSETTYEQDVSEVRRNILLKLENANDLYKLAEVNNTNFDHVLHEYENGKGVSEEIEELIQTMLELSHIASEESMGLDLHEGNFAMRGDKLVILDPFYSNDDWYLAMSVLKLSHIQLD